MNGGHVEDGFPAQACANCEAALIEAIVSHDRVLLVQQLSNLEIQVFEKTVDHYLLLCGRNFDLESSLECWQVEIEEYDRTNQPKNQWIWKSSEELPPYHFSRELLNLANEL